MNTTREFFQKGFLGIAGLALASTSPKEAQVITMTKKDKEYNFKLAFFYVFD